MHANLHEVAFNMFIHTLNSFAYMYSIYSQAVFVTCVCVLSLFLEWEYSHQVECGNNHEGRSIVSEERGRGTEKVRAFA